MELREETIWKLIDTYFQDNSQALVRHHIESYNDFFRNGLQQIFKETNPLKLELDYDNDKKVQDFRSKAHMYFGGKDGTKIYIGKPTIHDDGNPHYMFPNECRLRNMTYALTVHYDLEIEFTRILGEGEIPTTLDEKGSIVFDCDFDEDEKQDRRTLFSPSEMARMREQTNKTMTQQNLQTFCMTLEKLYLGKFPIMVQSDFCILQGMPREMRHRMGECRNDIGGYFIIDGKEKTVICQEKFGDNMLYIRKASGENASYLYSAEIRSVSENVSKPVRTLKVQIVAPTSKYTNHNIVVVIPNVRVPIPLFILFRALGVITDKEIIGMCTLQNPCYTNPLLVDYFNASIYDAGEINNQHDALKTLSLYIKGQTITKSLHILADYFLPHVGETNFLEKAYHLGYMVRRLLFVASGIEEPTDRDNYKYKRVELIGPMMKDLFREYYANQQHHIRLTFERIYDPSQAEYNDISTLIYRNYKDVFRDRMVETGFRKAFKGDWGSEQHTKRIGVTQDMNRLSHNGMISHLRKTNLPMDASMKIVGPRLLHNTQWGLIDPIDTPDGGNVGLHKHLAIMSYITPEMSREPMIQWLRDNTTIKPLSQCISTQLANITKVIVNGYWCGVVSDPLTMIKEMKLHRRHGLLPIYASISFEIRKKELQIYVDGGRLCRPLFYKDEINEKFIFETSEWKRILEVLEKGDKQLWNHVISGFHPKSDSSYDPLLGKIYKWEELYKEISKDKIQSNKALLEYIDTNESENALVAMNNESLLSSPLSYTHRELHESTMFGVLCNLINYPENNPATRNSFSCGQSKQACSMYSTNHQVRMDKTAVLLNYGQVPLVKSRYMQYINNEENPYGENAIVAIMCYTGYNVEDAILINEGALQRGLFRTTYYTTYEAHEEKEIKREQLTKETLFGNIENTQNIIGTKEGYDYSMLDENGMIRENTDVTDKTILIGMSDMIPNKDARKDSSKKPKKGQLGVVDKVFMTDGEEGQRIAKVRIREERLPNLGDKFASRAGQKGTVGMVIPEQDMPYTHNGVKPDIIINPHALPSRMTIGQMIECITGKICSITGTFGDCTAYTNKTSKLGLMGEMLTAMGFHSTGNEIMYNGMTGGQLDSEIFIGPTYYMRLKHMVKDKINYRSTGPRANLTRQAVSGRANDGGLRIGEMERDAVISHGASAFLQESMMKRGDEYLLAICNTTGMIAIYNPARNLMLSPMADGPLQYTGSLMTGQQEVQQLTRFSRTFSLVKVPYSLKLLMQELQAINIRVSIITEDNISQIDNMGFSKNIDLIVHKKDAIVADIIRHINKKVDKMETYKEPVVATPEDSVSPEYDPNAPGNENYYDDSVETNYKSPEYESTSPAFDPTHVYDPSPKVPSRLFEDDPVLQQFYENMKPKNKARLDAFNDKEKRWMVKKIWEQKQAKQGITMDNISETQEDTSQVPPVLQKGGKVHCRGDKKPQREWVVDKVGNHLYGIYTLDTDDLNADEHYKYVDPHEVYPLGNYLFVNDVDADNDSDIEFPMLPPNMMDDIQPQIPMSQNPAAENLDGKTNINFNPVIKVITDGNDNSQGMEPNGYTPQVQINPQIQEGSSLPQNQEMDESVIPQERSSINFNEPIIVKKQ
jgi:DNA-directed RNA polymerase II subunit RPB2